LLDEPTNNLDMASVRQLSQALESYRGAIVIASHDVPFLDTAGITRWLGRPDVRRGGFIGFVLAGATSVR
jgi:ATPase subunit of ABC transporter with duplicated ATPase domains